MFWVTVVRVTSLFLTGDCMYFWYGASTLEATFQICANGSDGKYSRNGNNRYGIDVYAASFDNWQYSLNHFSTPCFRGGRVMLLCKGLVNKQKMLASFVTGLEESHPGSPPNNTREACEKSRHKKPVVKGTS